MLHRFGIYLIFFPITYIKYYQYTYNPYECVVGIKSDLPRCFMLYQ